MQYFLHNPCFLFNTYLSVFKYTLFKTPITRFFIILIFSLLFTIEIVIYSNLCQCIFSSTNVNNLLLILPNALFPPIYPLRLTLGRTFYFYLYLLPFLSLFSFFFFDIVVYYCKWRISMNVPFTLDPSLH